MNRRPHRPLRRRRRRMRRRALGYTLFQLSMVFPLLVVFMVISSKLFLANHETTKQANQHQLRLGRADAALHRLRRDVMTLDHNHPASDEVTLLLEVPGVGEVLWHCDDAGDLTRAIVSGEQADTAPRRYTGLGDARFEYVPGGIVLVVDDERYLCPTGSAIGMTNTEGAAP